MSVFEADVRSFALARQDLDVRREQAAQLIANLGLDASRLEELIHDPQKLQALSPEAYRR